MAKKLDMTGLRFGRLTVVADSGERIQGKVVWVCICSCGTNCSVIGSHLRGGKTKSCGCIAVEKITVSNTTHGQSKSRLYRRWAKMLNRALNPNTKEYMNYGGRGIKVCDRWMRFENFAEDMQDGFSPELQIDRIDVNGDYCPENCRWATTKQQSINKRSSRHITFNGVTKTLSEWAEETGLKSSTILYRIRRGWDVQRSLTTAANSMSPDNA